MNSNTALQTFADFETFAGQLAVNGDFDRLVDCESTCPFWTDDSVCGRDACIWEETQHDLRTKGLIRPVGTLRPTSQDIESFADDVAAFVSVAVLPETQTRAVLDAYSMTRHGDSETQTQTPGGRRIRLLKTGARIIWDGKGTYFRPRRWRFLPFVKGNAHYVAHDLRRVDYGDLQSPNQRR